MSEIDTDTTFQELAAENARLKEENAELREFADTQMEGHGETRRELMEKLSEARAALEPFARLAGAAETAFGDREPPMPESDRLYSIGNGLNNGVSITLGHLRAAAKAMGGEDGE